MIETLLLRFQEGIKNDRLKSLILHGLFWTVWLSRSLFDVITPWGLNWGLVYILLTFLFQAPLVYLHLYVLVPRLLNKRYYIGYFLITASLIYAYSFSIYTALQALPVEKMPLSMSLYLKRIQPNYDILEGAIVVLLTYALKYTLIAFFTQNELLRLQKEKLQLELNALKAQIHPHFLFNTLNNLYSLTLKKSDKASEVVLKLSDIMRYVLYQANEDKVPLKKELDFIGNFMELQRIRYSDRYEINFNTEGITDELVVAPLLFIDFIENAFKHGLEKRFNDGFVRVNITILNTQLNFKVINSNGQVEELIPGRISQGIGLSNARKRLELIYPEKHNLEIIESKETYEINLKLELS